MAFILVKMEGVYRSKYEIYDTEEEAQEGVNKVIQEWERWGKYQIKRKTNGAYAVENNYSEIVEYFRIPNSKK